MDKKKVFDLCLCPSCPSWVECAERGGFCIDAVGRSKCIMEEKGCVCGACMVHKEMKMKKNYYCTRGSEKQQK